MSPAAKRRFQIAVEPWKIVTSTPSPPPAFTLRIVPATLTRPAKGSSSLRSELLRGKFSSTCSSSSGTARSMPSKLKPLQSTGSRKRWPRSLRRTAKLPWVATRSGQPSPLTSATA